MKNYIKINRAVDLKAIRQEQENEAYLQAIGAHPKELQYPLTLQFELTGACNLACKHCYNRSGDQDRRETTVMTPDKWRRLAGEIVRDGGIFQCIISGGEPLLLGDSLFDIMDILHDDGTSFIVITNGLLLTKEKVKRFKKYRFFWFQVSIDGATSELHDEFRGVKGSWERAVTGALEISHAGIPLVIAHSVTPKTLPTLGDTVELAYRLGANSIIVGDILPSGRAMSHDEILLSDEQKNEMFQKINELSQAYAGKITIERSMTTKMQLERYMASVNSGGIIRPNGDFRLDCMAPFVIGNVTEQSIREIWRTKGKNAWQSQQIKEFVASIDEDSARGNIRNHVDEDVRL